MPNSSLFRRDESDIGRGFLIRNDYTTILNHKTLFLNASLPSDIILLNSSFLLADDYIEFYDEQRPHAKLQYKTSKQKECEYKEKYLPRQKPTG